MAHHTAAIIGLTGIGAGAVGAAPSPSLGTLMPQSHMSAYAAAGIDVVAVCDLVQERLDACREQWAGAYPGLNGYLDYREMLAAERIDLLSVVTPDHRHAQIVADAAAVGVRGILCEKPIATTLADADRMVAACREHNVPLVIDHTRRWQPLYQEAYRLLRSGAIGAPTRIHATLGGPRAMLFRNGTHLIDTTCWFAGAEPRWLVAELDDEQRGYGPRYAGDGGRDPATDPGGSAYIHFENGVRAFISASKGTMTTFEIDVVGDNGRIRIGSQVAEIWQPVGDGEFACRTFQAPQTTRAGILGAVLELRDVVEGKAAITSTGADGRRATSVLLAILQSAHAGSVRVDFPVHDA